MKEKDLDFILVPLGMVILVVYHFWLVYTIHYNPRRTVIGINAETRHKWVYCLMTDPLKNGVLAVQTIRNNIMASTLLATAAITLSSLIGVYVSNSSGTEPSKIVYGNKSSIMASIKFFSILVCFLAAFLFNVQSIRYYAHVSFLVTVPTSTDKRGSMEYVARNLDKGSFFWSLGLREVELLVPSFPLDIWADTYVCVLLHNVISSLLLGYNYNPYKGSAHSFDERGYTELQCGVSLSFSVTPCSLFFFFFFDWLPCFSIGLGVMLYECI